MSDFQLIGEFSGLIAGFIVSSIGLSLFIRLSAFAFIRFLQAATIKLIPSDGVPEIEDISYHRM